MDAREFKRTDESIYELFDAIRKRPEMWIERRELIRLHHFIRGYGSALCRVQLTWKDAEPDFCLFDIWVAERLDFPESTPGWYNIIREHCASEREAFDRFYELLDEFRTRNG